MASIVVVGPDTELVEGVSQTLIGAGHKVMAAKDIPEALETLHGSRPLVALVDCEELSRNGSVFRVSLAEGGALLAFHGDELDGVELPFRLQRTTLAELRLPLERQRLLALVRYVETRARTAGRESVDGDGLEADSR